MLLPRLATCSPPPDGVPETCPPPDGVPEDEEAVVGAIGIVGAIGMGGGDAEAIASRSRSKSEPGGHPTSEMEQL